MKTVVVGGGAGGMMAAIFAARSGNSVVLIEKNEKLGKKIYITGKGRCNVTNNCTPEEFLENVLSNPKFLSGAIHSFTPSDCIAFFQSSGLPLKTERGGRVFPQCEKASAVIKCLEKCLKDNKVEILLNTEMTGLVIKNGEIAAVKTKNGSIDCEKVILSTGGVTYPSTGSDGTGIRIAHESGHNVIPLRGSLNGLKTETLAGVAGLTLKNVAVSVTKEDKVLASEFGELLFTHTGVSGPTILSISGKINRLTDFKNCCVEIDLKPALDAKALDLRLQRDFKENNNKLFENSLDALLPRSLIAEVIRRSEIAPSARVHQITSQQRKNLASVLKQFKLKLYGHEDIETAVVSAGGVDTKQINPATMESKIVKGLYFAGEMIDVDALTGGYNLQIAFSTGVRAGISAAGTDAQR